jgi:hypothetical protein
MARSQEKALKNHRLRLKKKGLRRVEVEAREADASLIRQLAKTLRTDGDKGREVRQSLIDLLASEQAGLKELLLSAPLEGIRITRSRDTGRPVEL